MTELDRLYQARKTRREHPSGKFDNGGRWHPSEQEECDCCRFIRTPSRAFPYSLMLHCRTKSHIRQLLAKQAVEGVSA